MANTVLNPSIIAKTSVRILENELVMGSHVYRGYEDEFDKKINGYDVGDTISIRKPQTVHGANWCHCVDPAGCDRRQALPRRSTSSRGVDFDVLQPRAHAQDRAARRSRDSSRRWSGSAIDRRVDLMNLFTADPELGGTARHRRGRRDRQLRGVRAWCRTARPDGRARRHALRQSWRPTATGRWLVVRLGAVRADKSTTQAYRRGEIGDIGGVEHLHVAERADVHRHRGQRDTSLLSPQPLRANQVFCTTYREEHRRHSRHLRPAPGAMDINL